MKIHFSNKNNSYEPEKNTLKIKLFQLNIDFFCLTGFGLFLCLDWFRVFLCSDCFGLIRCKSKEDGSIIQFNAE